MSRIYNTVPQENYSLHTQEYLTDHECIHLLLSYLNKRGVYFLTEDELAKKLYYYRTNLEYRNLFSNIALSSNEEKVDISNAMSYEKYFSGCISWLSGSEKLRLLYGFDEILTKMEQQIDPYYLYLLNQIASQLAHLFQIENQSEHRLHIYGLNPTQTYSTLCAKNCTGIYQLRIITDGTVTSRTLKSGRSKEEPFLIFPDPCQEKKWTHFSNFITAQIQFSNPTFVMIQGVSQELHQHQQLNHSTLYTDLQNPADLITMLHLANEVSLKSDDIPFVKQIRL